ncbi:kinase-like protein [Annulohypoxylon moriforme]|nr:kinase-like protein [Annulohypoxylon moriforme]
MPASVSSESESNPCKYFPCQLGESEDLENYEPGGFHPVHLGDVYDDRYRVIHKLGFGGFSTVWLAQDTLTKRWVSLKIVAARESPTYEARSVIANHPSITESHLFAANDREFWFEGPNGRHLCLVSLVLGPDLSKLSNGIYTRVKPQFAREVSLLTAQALVSLHSNGLCHGDFTANNIALRLTDKFNSYEEDDLFNLFGRPKTSPLITYSGNPPAPHAPNYNVVPLNFCSANINVLSREICAIDFDQSFTVACTPTERPGIPAKCLAPEVAVGQPPSPASDVWALGCAIFRIRSGFDLFFDYDTDCPADVLRQIVKTMGELPEKWKQTRFDEDGFPVGEGESGEVFWSLEQTKPLEDRIKAIIDNPASLFINDQGEPLEAADIDIRPRTVPFSDDVGRNVPYSAELDSMVWKPTAICVDGDYFVSYSDETDAMLEAFPKIAESEASLLLDLLSRIFTYDPEKRIKAEEIVKHPWFHMADSR